MILKHPKVKLDILPQDRLDLYIWLMEDTWDLCESLIMTEKIADKNSKPMKMPNFEMSRDYDGNFKPPKPYHICPACTEPFMHEAVRNEEARKLNIKKSREYKQAVRDNTDGDGNQIGAKVPKPKIESEVLVCKAYTMRHSFVKKGYHCSNCTDRLCKLCSNNCRFVCTKQ